MRLKSTAADYDVMRQERKKTMATSNCCICGKKIEVVGEFLNPNPITLIQYLCKAHTEENQNYPGDLYHRQIVFKGKKCLVNCYPDKSTCYMITSIGQRYYHHVGDIRNGASSQSIITYKFNDKKRASIREVYTHSAHCPLRGEYTETTVRRDILCRKF